MPLAIGRPGRLPAAGGPAGGAHTRFSGPAPVGLARHGVRATRPAVGTVAHTQGVERMLGQCALDPARAGIGLVMEEDLPGRLVHRETPGRRGLDHGRGRPRHRLQVVLLRLPSRSRGGPSLRGAVVSHALQVRIIQAAQGVGRRRGQARPAPSLACTGSQRPLPPRLPGSFSAQSGPACCPPPADSPGRSGHRSGCRRRPR